MQALPPVSDGQGHTIRYDQRDAAPTLRPTSVMRSRTVGPASADRVPEGEKKALKADQEGLACVAIGGLWNWRAGGQPARSTAPTSPGEGKPVLGASDRLLGQDASSALAG